MVIEHNAASWDTWEQRAEALDRADPERWLPGRFFPSPGLYFDGNSLGVMSRQVPAQVNQVLREWRVDGVMAWNLGPDPWFGRVESTAARLAPLIGAAPAHVTLLPSTTVGLHQLLATLYRPSGRRTRIVMDADAFPTDRYAALSHLALHGRPARDLTVVANTAEGFVDPDRLADAFTAETALAVLPSVVYTTGQRLPLGRLTETARRQGIPVIWDLCHSAGLMPHKVDADGVDAAVFCTYKYLSAGPGAPAGVYLNPRYLPVMPGLGGWWGSAKDQQFQMAFAEHPSQDAGALQLGTPSMLALAPLLAVLPLFEEVGIAALWERSQQLTRFLAALAEEILTPRGFRVVRPPNLGGHVAVGHPHAFVLNLALRERRVIVDYRPPSLLRLCPSPLTARYTDIVELVRTMAALTDDEEAVNRADGIVPPVV